jgi:hypothetical protein
MAMPWTAALMDESINDEAVGGVMDALALESMLKVPIFAALVLVRMIVAPLETIEERDPIQMLPVTK